MRSKKQPPSTPDLVPAPKRKSAPHAFVVDALSSVSPYTHPMFGCLAVYVGEKIVLILRDKPKYPDDNGVWLATTREHHASLSRDFPNMRSIGLLGEKVSSWQVLPMTAPDFEEAALHACELVIAGDPRIGRVPASRRSKQSSSKPSLTTDASQKPGEKKTSKPRHKK